MLTRPWNGAMGLWLVVWILAPGCGSTASLERAPEPQPSATMRQGVAALADLLPMAFDRSMWARPGVAQGAERSVKALREAAQDLDWHSERGDVSFKFLIRSLSREAAELERDIASQRYEHASERMVRLAGTCTACHARLPGEGQDRVGRALFARVDERSLSPAARAELQAATRQFDAALETYERQFADPFDTAVLLEGSEALPSYLILTLRVRRDFERARHGLSLLEQRSELSPDFRRDLATWREALVRLGPVLHQASSLEAARSILEEGRGLEEIPWPGPDIVYSIVASSLLYRYIEERRPQGEELAEALYLLARSDAFTFRSFDLQEPQYYLEQAVRIAPHTEIAERAHALLELQAVLINQAFGQPIPDDVQLWLRELGELSQRLSEESHRE